MEELPTEGYALILGCIRGKDEVGEHDDDERLIIYENRADADLEIKNIKTHEYIKISSDPSYDQSILLQEIEIDHYVGWCDRENNIYRYYALEGTPLFTYDYANDSYTWN